MGHLKQVCLVANSKSKDWTKVILQHLQACTQRLKNQTDTCDTIWHSRASACITNNKNDFMTPIKKIQNCKANGISGAMGITRSGRVRWSLINTAGEPRHIELECCHAPSATQQLLSTSVFCKQHPKNTILLTPKSWTAQPNPNEPEENLIDIIINPILNNLPTT